MENRIIIFAELDDARECRLINGGNIYYRDESDGNAVWFPAQYTASAILDHWATACNGMLNPPADVY